MVRHNHNDKCYCLSLVCYFVREKGKTQGSHFHKIRVFCIFSREAVLIALRFTLSSFRLDPPERTNYNQTVRVPANTFVTLSCPVDGNPEPDITWYEGNDTSGTLVQSGKEWTFSKATSSDCGWFTCFANNSLNRPVLVRLQLLVVGKLRVTGSVKINS